MHLIICHYYKEGMSHRVLDGWFKSRSIFLGCYKITIQPFAKWMNELQTAKTHRYSKILSFYLYSLFYLYIFIHTFIYIYVYRERGGEASIFNFTCSFSYYEWIAYRTHLGETEQEILQNIIEKCWKHISMCTHKRGMLISDLSCGWVC